MTNVVICVFISQFQSSLEDFSESLENEDASYAVAEYSWHIGTYYDAYLKCEENKNPKACHGAIKEEIEEQTEKLYQKLIAAVSFLPLFSMITQKKKLFILLFDFVLQKGKIISISLY